MFNDESQQTNSGSSAANNVVGGATNNNNQQSNAGTYTTLHAIAASLFSVGAPTFVSGTTGASFQNMANAVMDKIGYGATAAADAKGVHDVKQGEGNIEQTSAGSQAVTKQDHISHEVNGGGVKTYEGHFAHGDKCIDVKRTDTTAQTQAKVELAKIDSAERMHKEELEAKERAATREHELTKQVMQDQEKQNIRNAGLGLIASAAVIEVGIAGMQFSERRAAINRASEQQATIDSGYEELNRICVESERDYVENYRDNPDVTISQLEAIRATFEMHLRELQTSFQRDLVRAGIMRCNAKVNQINAQIAGIANRNQLQQQQERAVTSARQQRQQQIDERLSYFTDRVNNLLNATADVDVSTSFAALESEITQFTARFSDVQFATSLTDNIARLREEVAARGEQRRTRGGFTFN